MAYDAKLAERVRDAIGPLRGLDEIKMFGGLCFTVNGNMACGVLGDDLMVRVPAEDHEELLGRPGARPMDMMKGRTPKGFLFIDATGTNTKAKLDRWITRSIAFATSLPPKSAKKKARTGRPR